MEASELRLRTWSMWDASPRERAWPVVPRPFPDEAFGGWIARVAARYRMSVEELAATYQLEVPACAAKLASLLLPAMKHSALERLAALGRLDIALIERMQTPTAWCTERSALMYCPTCLFLNPADVTSPRWLRKWLDPNCEYCDVHNEPLSRVGAGALCRCRNFGHVLRLASRRERERQVQKYGWQRLR